MIMERKNLIFLGLSLLVNPHILSQNNNMDTRPNILVIVVDDMGFSDTQPFGGEIYTPNISKLAEHGIRFTRFHTSSMSAPTRAMLLTGVDNHQNGLGMMPPMHAKNQYLQPGYEGFLNNHVMTIAELLRNEGY